jgi:hypothetical protein
MNTTNSGKKLSKISCKLPQKQKPYRTKIERIAKANPDLCYEDIIGILLGLEDLKNGNAKEYKSLYT